LDAAHVIFHQPLKVDLAYAKEDTPEHYRKYFDGKNLPDKLNVWRVHGKLQEKNYGLVSDGYGFADSPDCEYISGGINSKGPTSMALGRQANWFLWGFCAPPEEMTKQARKVFVNTVFYMEQFDGRKPLVKRTHRAREWALNYTRYLDNERLQQYGSKQFSQALLEACEGSGSKLHKMLQENMDYLVITGRFRIDEDAKALGISNRDPKLLERCVSMLEKGQDTERALRLLKRYTTAAGQCADDASKWRKWLDSCGDRLYFSDTAGYRWHVKQQVWSQAPLRRKLVPM
jgi:hypothetical protein